MAETEEQVKDEQVEVEATAQAETQTEGQTEGQAESETTMLATVIPTAEESKTVPYERFEEVVNQVKALSEQVAMANQQLAIAKANPIQKEGKPSESDLFKQIGLSATDEDVPSGKQLKQIVEHIGTVWDTRLAWLEFQLAHPDYAELVGTADEIASGKYAESLAAALKQNPALIKMIAGSNNPRLAAYEIAKLQKEKTKTDKPVTKEDAKSAIDEAVKNANRIKSSSTTKGGEALSEEGRFAKMSDTEFVTLALSHGAIV